MAIAKRKGVETAEDRMLADRVARARKANPPRDPTGEHHAACAEIARAAAVDVGDVLDDWDHEASIIEYERGCLRADAERVAVEHVRDRHLRQKEMLRG